ncbi:hypothetical protein KY309_01275 [Candidatus Woesearchaeota archaeon]|nr:hypothetical protein [Candidatus Woesearchaeota archaeon]MBW3016223.1 hypothetical protein [Candidatus Woesearchaeota archaeon]
MREDYVKLEDALESVDGGSDEEPRIYSYKQFVSKMYDSNCIGSPFCRCNRCTSDCSCDNIWCD